MVIIIEIYQKSFRYCKKMNPKNTDVKNYKRQKILKKQKDSKPTNYIYIYMCVCVCVCVITQQRNIRERYVTLKRIIHGYSH